MTNADIAGRLAEALRVVDEDVRHHLRDDRIDMALIRAHAVRTIREALAAYATTGQAGKVDCRSEYSQPLHVTTGVKWKPLKHPTWANCTVVVTDRGSANFFGPDHASDAAAFLASPPAAGVRTCTCHPEDKPPVPCPQKFALNDCRAAALSTQTAGVTDNDPLEAAYLSLLKLPHSKPVRWRMQKILATLRDEVAFARGEFPEDVQNEFERRAATQQPEGVGE